MGRIAVRAVLAGLLFAGSQAQGQGYSVAGSGGSSGTSGTGAETAPAGSGSQSAGSAVAAGVNEGRRSRDSIRAPNDPGQYGGLVPGTHVPPRMARQASASRHRAAGGVVVEWPGFQMRPEGSRVFLAVSAPPTVVPETAPGRLIYRVRNARVPVRNNRRTLETGAFNTPVQRAYLRQRGRDVELVIELRTQIAPQVTQETNPQGLSYVNVDFAAWTPPDHGANQLLLPPQQSGIRPSAEPQGADAPTGTTGGADTEQPPPANPGN